MRKFLHVLASGLLLVALSAPALAQSVYRVSRVVDGDTVVLRGLGTVRLIGIDTPETVDPRKPVERFGKEASAALRAMIAGRDVVVEYDQDRADKYNRTLAYLYLTDGTFVNLEMVRQGYAHAYVKYPFREMSRFRAAEREARAAERGLWSDSAGDTTLSAAAVQTRPSTARVWVNTSSGVYHCEGTRYYGNTKRGAFMSESAARAEGRRPAGGRPCG